MDMSFRKGILFLFFILVGQSGVFSQEIATDNLQTLEDSINIYLTKIFISKDDAEKEALNEKMIVFFREALQNKESFDHPFSTLKYVGKMMSDDEKVRIYNWNLAFKNGTYQYFAFIQVKNKKELKVFQLIDKSNQIIQPEKASLDYKNWYGCLYYQIIEKKDGSKKYYNLIGWDGNNDFTNKKIIDVLYFTSKGEPRFGANLFKIEKKRMKRVIFEYSKRATMALRYDDRYKMIIYDHLSPSKANYKGMYQYYGPDFTHDALTFKKGKWQYLPNIDVTNPKSDRKRYKKEQSTIINTP